MAAAAALNCLAGTVCQLVADHTGADPLRVSLDGGPSSRVFRLLDSDPAAMSTALLASAKLPLIAAMVVLLADLEVPAVMVELAAVTVKAALVVTAVLWLPVALLLVLVPGLPMATGLRVTMLLGAGQAVMVTVGGVLGSEIGEVLADDEIGLETLDLVGENKVSMEESRLPASDIKP